MAAMQINPPEHFTFSTPANWSKWKIRFERYRIASGLSTKTGNEQVNSLIYIMGEQAEDIFSSFGLSVTEQANFDIVLKRFNDHFIVKKNTIFERAQFNKRVQLDGESVNTFITALYSLAEHCEYGTLHDELIRDRIVVGIRDKNLSEKLQLDADLTLTKVIERVRLSEVIKEQQEKLSSNENTSVNAISQNKSQRFQKQKQTFVKSKQSVEPEVNKKFNENNSRLSDKCKWCGKSKHDKRVCPARDAKCRKCSKIGHYAHVCLSKHQKKYSEVAFLGIVRTENKNKTNIDWTVTVQVDCKNVKFKIDSGADHTVLPADVFRGMFKNTKLQPPDKILCGPDKSALKTLGKFKANIKFKEKCCAEEIYVIDNLQTCLLGKPALLSLGLGPNLSSISHISTIDPKVTFPDLFQGLGLMKGCYTIQLKPGSTPLAITSPRRVPIPLLKQTEAELKRMVEQKVIIPVTQPTEWCSPVVIVPKSDGNVRICVDLSELNKNVRREIHPLPKTEYTLNLLSGAKVFSKLDANSGFWQIPLDKKSSYLTTFITPFGRFRFLRLPFGISSAPEHFQRRMSQMLSGIPGTVCHMDDILILRITQEEHNQRLTEVCKRLKDSGMTLNSKKCSFNQSSIKFLGHIIDEQGIHPDSDKIAAIENCKPPTNKKELKQLLGMANYLAKFVPNYSTILSPLYSLLSNKVTFMWGSPQQEAFQKLKHILSSDPVLTIFDPEKETIVTTDASSYGLGATICQKQADGRKSVIAYASRTLTPAESHYAQIEKEALAIVWGCEKFRDYLTGIHFKLETDHKPLVPIFSKKNLDDLSPRLQRMKLKMMKFSYTIVHIPGKELYAADALSRNPLTSPCKREELEDEIDAYIQMITDYLPASSCKLKELSAAQLKDATCQKLTEYALKGWPQKKEVDKLCTPYWQNRYEISLQDGLLMRGCRIIIPKSHQVEVLNKIHEGHLGITKCRARARCSVYWPGINKEIEEKIKNCTSCIQESSNRHQPLIPTPFPERPWEIIGMDLFKLNGVWYLIVTDYYSRYPEIARLERLTASEIINHCKSIFARHGIPDIVRTDNGPQFESINSSEFAEFSRNYGFRHITSSPRYPQSNGFVESAVKTIKFRLKKSEDPYLALMTYRATPLENGLSPAELLFNRRIQTTLPIAKSQLEPKLESKIALEKKEEKRIEKQTINFNKRHGVRNLDNLNPGDTVWITDRRNTGKVVHSTEHPRSYIVESGKKQYRRNRMHLIPSTDFQPVTDEVDDFDTGNQRLPSVPSPAKSDKQDSHVTSTKPVSSAPPAPYTTRCGRVVRPPKRLDL